MNKLGKRILGITLGLALVGGVGMCVATYNKVAIKLNAEDTNTYDYSWSTKPGTSEVTFGDVTWTISNVSNLNGFNSMNYQGVQIGSSKNNGSYTLTSKYDWGCQDKTASKGYTAVSEINLWMNLGGTSMSAVVMVGDSVIPDDGTTVVKNTGATSQREGTTKVSYKLETPSTGKVSIAFNSVKAGYFCSMQVIANKPSTPTPEEELATWSKSFYEALKGGTNPICKEDGTTDTAALTTAWNTQATAFGDLSEEAKELAVGASSEGDTDTAKAMRLYDFCTSKYSTSICSRFITGRDTQNAPKVITSDTTTTIAIVSVVALLSVSAIGGYFFVKKTKHE